MGESVVQMGWESVRARCLWVPPPFLVCVEAVFVNDKIPSHAGWPSTQVSTGTEKLAMRALMVVVMLNLMLGGAAARAGDHVLRAARGGGNMCWAAWRGGH
jgi:hypothetical protein